MSRAGAAQIISALRKNPRLLLCAATGSTPTRTYELLAEEFRLAPGLFRELRVLKLDDWGGLAMDDPGTSEIYVQGNLIRPLKISANRYTGFESNPADPAKECQRIETWLSQNGPIDLCVLGLGVNGHLAMNEPASTLQPRCHVATLSATTLQHSMLANARRPPKFGLTLGMAGLLQSKKLLLLVSGGTKREPLARLLEGKISTQLPASFLWLHADALCLCDAEAAAMIKPPTI